MKHRCRIGRSLLSFLLIVILVLGSTAVYGATETAVDAKALAQKIDEAMAETMGCKPGQVLQQEDWFVVGSNISDWMAIALKLNGVKEDYQDYLTRLEAEVTDRYAKNGTLNENMATEYHRFILTVVALGGDPTSFGKHPDGTPVNLLEEGIFNYTGELDSQGMNGYTWALVALDAAECEIPEGAKYTREMIVDAILEAQLPEGAFGLTEAADTDITAMTMQALAPYMEDSRVKHAVEQALNWLAGQVQDDCGIASYDEKNPESVSQAIIALTALQKDPEQEEAFVRGSQTLLTQLQQFQLGDGTYFHSPEAPVADYMATEQALIAMTAVELYRTSGKRIYDFQNQSMTDAGTGSGGFSMKVIIPVVLVIVILGVGLLLLNSKNKSKASR